MPKKTFTPEQIVAKLRQIVVLISQGKDPANQDIWKQLSLREFTLPAVPESVPVWLACS